MEVFINCPFDPEYEPLRNRIIFVLLWAGLKPVLASDFGNSNEPRFSRICKLLRECPVSIHDLSRNKCQCGKPKKMDSLSPQSAVPAEMSTKPKTRTKRQEEHYRLNMPLELGYAMACMDLSRDDSKVKKRIFIMANHRSDVLIAANDINNYDPAYHLDQGHKVTKIVRDFLIQNLIPDEEHFISGHKLEIAFMEFAVGLSDLTTTEIKKLASQFITKNKERIEYETEEPNSSTANK